MVLGWSPGTSGGLGKRHRHQVPGPGRIVLSDPRTCTAREGSLSRTPARSSSPVWRAPLWRGRVWTGPDQCISKEKLPDLLTSYNFSEKTRRRRRLERNCNEMIWYWGSEERSSPYSHGGSSWQLGLDFTICIILQPTLHTENCTWTGLTGPAGAPVIPSSGSLELNRRISGNSNLDV